MAGARVWRAFFLEWKGWGSGAAGILDWRFQILDGGPQDRWVVGRGSGAMGIRTPDLLNAIEALYQLSYDP